ncbi:O-methyltransferase [Terribacillus sp. DMT04]|uniref:O-methyltransferase n=1 Tax=Terribacillus sp. DMT04 TaxID=2850441 RepID=UPI001C2C7059|nr:O-methyltransferase [Terribacillus sp. DMT04]QXE00509.1 O-methyltransferase [Terribacillus sp. DMT04]
MLQAIMEYLEEHVEPSPEWAVKLEELAAAEQVPIMEPLGIQFLMQVIRLQQPKKILEIGTAIGYSALMMRHAKPDVSIVTVERDEIRYNQAVAHIQKQGAQDDIVTLKGDAFDLEETIKAHGPYDFVFIDAAKGQYQRFFEAYSSMLSNHGVIVSDNVLFKGYVADDKEATPRKANIAKKIRKYNNWLFEHEAYHTTILPVGDGVAVSVKKK